ncbi:hypothetical protein B0A52_04427 [Exophiala mesophila]|uniref:Uncharacterized protein n=1 Tax=Exophiala mesophila TaxID=212818 RepID=A0A438N8X0_EXOME|nr:hypothetical protein B0A52_04427 [Exophiala mesophila]
MSDTVETPTTPRSPHGPDTLESVTALARFEFEPHKGNQGTKVMMVEWQDDEPSRDKSGKWHVSWSGKRSVFPADDASMDNIRRVYFLLPPGTTIPPHVTLSYHPPAPATSTSTTTSPDSETPLRKMTVYPLPAIFTPELGATAKASGKKGVLHTIWAKKRLSVLEKEIKREEHHNLEGIALEMARSEKAWIEANFGLALKPPTLDLSNLPTNVGPTSPGIQSPRSPGGRRLSEKLKGLSLATGEKDLAGRGLNTVIREEHPLSPEASDIAHSSFSSFHQGPMPTTAKRIVAQPPPDFLIKQQGDPTASSLSFLATASLQDRQPAPSQGNDPSEDDLFAVALSPRSPDGPKSPFSISSAEVGAFAKIKGDR